MSNFNIENGQIIVDSSGDLWFEVSPGMFRYSESGSREEAVSSSSEAISAEQIDEIY